MNLSIFLSGTGSNFKAIAAAIERGELEARIVLVASNKTDAPGLEAARGMGLSTAIFDRSTFPDGASFAAYMLSTLEEHKVDFIALAGYMRKIPSRVINAYRNRIINIHPALLPRFGGKGMYGLSVHRAVLDAGVSESGVTIHCVDEIYDHGEIIAQRKVPVLPEDTPEELAARVLKVEHQFYPEVLQRLANEFHHLQVEG